MHIRPEDLPVLIEQGPTSLRVTEWGGMYVLLYTIPAGTDMKRLMTGLPDDLCPCPHWGYVLQGRLRIRHKDFEQVVTAGEAFFVEPGHAPLFEEDTRMLEFSPKQEWLEMMSTVARNLASMAG